MTLMFTYVGYLNLRTYMHVLSIECGGWKPDSGLRFSLLQVRVGTMYLRVILALSFLLLLVQSQRRSKPDFDEVNNFYVKNVSILVLIILALLYFIIIIIIIIIIILINIIIIIITSIIVLINIIFIIIIILFLIYLSI